MTTEQRVLVVLVDSDGFGNIKLVLPRFMREHEDLDENDVALQARGIHFNRILDAIAYAQKKGIEIVEEFFGYAY